MSIIALRPTLWNQYKLIEERDKYNANDVFADFTGWTQINGREECPIENKVKLDGKDMEKRSLWFDTICFFGLITAVVRRTGAIEDDKGVTAKMNEQNQEGKSSSHSNLQEVKL